MVAEKFIKKIGRHVVGSHLEGTVSQNVYLGLSLYLMKSRKLSCKK